MGRSRGPNILGRVDCFITKTKTLSENGICKLETIKHLCYNYMNVQLSTRNMTNVTYLTEFSRARFARVYFFPILRY